jgi:hypothetical protein
MRIFGVDFTSAPGPAKPIVAARCSLAGDRLAVEGFLTLRDLAAFERGLAAPGPWVAGLDFPFGMPRRLGHSLGWPGAWEDYVGQVAALGGPGWEELLNLYRAAQAAGDREHLRATDRLARAKSPMKLYGVPVAKMFFAGAPRLLASGVCVIPCRPNGDDRVALEAYPALVAHRLLGRRPGRYKAEARREQTSSQERERRALAAALASPRLRATYGLELAMDRFLVAEAVADPLGDRLDAVLAAVQAAWGCGRRAHGWGAPEPCDRWEGWIVDPATAARAAAGGGRRPPSTS